jgi:hypothetical protein
MKFSYSIKLYYSRKFFHDYKLKIKKFSLKKISIASIGILFQEK